MIMIGFIKFSVIVFEKYSVFIQYIFQAWLVNCFIFKSNVLKKSNQI